MKIGVAAFISSYSIDPGTMAKRCEELGFEAFYLPEHVIIPVANKTPYPYSKDGKIPESYAHFVDPFIGLAFAAAATEKISLGTGVCLVPEHDPLVLAKVVATLDHLSGGRVILGIGAGWLADESEIMGVNFKRRWAMTRECIRAMKELWTKPEASFEGEFIKFPPVKSYPKPVRQPHPPVHIGAGTGGQKMDRALRDTVAIGDGWMPTVITPEAIAPEISKLKQMCADAGRDFSKLEITVYPPPVKSDPKKLREQYRETGVHRLVFLLDAPLPGTYEKQLENLAKAWVD
jgi:probable F420-dependent oxidoreductase